MTVAKKTTAAAMQTGLNHGRAIAEVRGGINIFATLRYESCKSKRCWMFWRTRLVWKEKTEDVKCKATLGSVGWSHRYGVMTDTFDPRITSSVDFEKFQEECAESAFKDKGC